jgi:hypothetical protein
MRQVLFCVIHLKFLNGSRIPRNFMIIICQRTFHVFTGLHFRNVIILVFPNSIKLLGGITLDQRLILLLLLKATLRAGFNQGLILGKPKFPSILLFFTERGITNPS